LSVYTFMEILKLLSACLPDQWVKQQPLPFLWATPSCGTSTTPRPIWKRQWGDPIVYSWSRLYTQRRQLNSTPIKVSLGRLEVGNKGRQMYSKKPYVTEVVDAMLCKCNCNSWTVHLSAIDTRHSELISFRP